MKSNYMNSLVTPLGCIMSAGFIDKSQTQWFEAMRVFGSYGLVYLLEGRGTYYDANRLKVSLTAGDMIVLFPELAHSYGPLPGSTWKEMYLVFNGPVFDLWRETGLLASHSPVRHLQPVDEWTSQLGFMLQDDHTQATGIAAHLSDLCKLLTALTEAATIESKFGESHDATPWLSRASNVLGINLDEVIHPHDVAALLGMPPDTFRRKFKTATGLAPGQFRAMKRIEAAKALIRNSDMTQAEIAEQLGFCDAFHFSRRFKQITGVTPRSYRKQLR